MMEQAVCLPKGLEVTPGHEGAVESESDQERHLTDTFRLPTQPASWDLLPLAGGPELSSGPHGDAAGCGAGERAAVSWHRAQPSRLGCLPAYHSSQTCASCCQGLLPE